LLPAYLLIEQRAGYILNILPLIQFLFSLVTDILQPLLTRCYLKKSARGKIQVPASSLYRPLTLGRAFCIMRSKYQRRIVKNKKLDTPLVLEKALKKYIIKISADLTHLTVEQVCSGKGEERNEKPGKKCSAGFDNCVAGVLPRKSTD